MEYEECLELLTEFENSVISIIKAKNEDYSEALSEYFYAKNSPISNYLFKNFQMSIYPLL